MKLNTLKVMIIVCEKYSEFNRQYYKFRDFICWGEVHMKDSTINLNKKIKTYKTFAPDFYNIINGIFK